MRRYHVFAIITMIAVAALVTAVVTRPGHGEQSLFHAVENGDVRLARILIERGVHPDEPRTLGLTPLMRAALRDQIEMTQLLLDAGADLYATDTGGLGAAHIAAEGNAIGSLRVLASAGADLHERSRSNMNVIQHAAARGSVDVIEVLASEFDLDEPSAVITGGHGAPRVIGPSTLGIAVLNGQIDAVDVLLEMGADVNAPSTSGPTPLLIAIFTNQPASLVTLLLAHGADPTVVAECNLACSGEPGDALHWAMVLNRSEILPFLEDA